MNGSVNRLLATENNRNLYFYHLDRLGSPIMITDKSGAIVKQKKYEAFGNLKWQSGTFSDNREFTSKEKDPTGFHYFGARYYSGDIGRFLSPDPHTLMPGGLDLSNPQSITPYVYCVNDPLRYKDPNGEFILAVEHDQSAQYGSTQYVWSSFPRSLSNAISYAAMNRPELAAMSLAPNGVYYSKTRADAAGTNAAARSWRLYDYKLDTKPAGKSFAPHKALLINNGGKVPTEEININPRSKYYGEKAADRLWVHAGSRKKDIGGTGSEGCITVPTVLGDKEYRTQDPETWIYYNDWISNFENDPEGKLLIIRFPTWMEDLGR
jgi:RHS repeat-associated protein